MGAEDNIKTIQAISTVAPWYGVKHGKDGVGSFFAAFGTTMDVGEFAPLTYAANDDAVFTLVRFRGSPRSTKKTIEMTLHHYFRFRGGKIFYYRGTEDSAQTEAALRP